MDQDLFLYGGEKLRSIASDEVLKKGLADFSDNRVFSQDMPGDRLNAEVEDADNNQPVCRSSKKLSAPKTGQASHCPRSS